MPELPEVETIKRSLEQKIIGKKIVKIEVIQKKSIKNSLKKFTETVEGNYIKSIKRKGKYLIFELKSNEQYLLIHLKMTGHRLSENSETYKFVIPALN
jgi:formamidopyrimidine-DNA glycosylase